MPQRILYVHHRPELGGSPTSLAHLIRRLDPDEFEAHVYCPPGPATELFRDAGATVHTGPVAGFTHVWASSYQGRRWLLFGREVVRLPHHLKSLGALMRREHFDLVHLNDSPLIPAGMLARRRGLPVVWHLRSALAHEGRDVRSGLVRSAIRRLANVSIAINEDIARVFDVGAHVVPNVVDLDEFRPDDPAKAKEALGLPPDVPTVAFVGFIYPLKGFREFIAAAKRIHDRGIAAQFLVVGGGVRGEDFYTTLTGRVLEWLGLAENYEREARDLVHQYGLQDVIRFVPFMQHTARVYQASDVVVAPSRGPELGRPLIEAAACGVPVVASGSATGGGILVPDQTGVLVHGFGVDTLGDELEGLLRDPERRRALGQAARLHAEARFDQRANAAEVQDIYRSLIRVPERPERPERAGQPERTPILFVHHRPQLGGAPSSLAVLIRELDPRFEPHVYTPEGPAADLFRRAGATVHPGPVAIFAHAWDSPYRGLRWLILSRELAALPPHLRHFNQLLSERRFPIVHLNDSPLLPAAFLAHTHGSKVVWHLRSALAGEGRDRRSRVIARLMDRWGDAAIAIDRDVAERFNIRLPVEIVHNSVGDEEPLDTAVAKRRLGFPEDKVVIGFAGFLRRQKGWPQLVEAAGILADERLPVHFVIMGGGIRPPEYFETMRGRLLEQANLLTNDEVAIKRQVEALGLTDYFSFLPFTTRTADVYSGLDIVTFPNQGVGLGRPVLEAAALGKPVVASGSHDGGGVMLPDETGILLDDPRPANIAAALRRLVLDVELRLRMGTAAADHARVQFDAGSNARAVEKVYDTLLGVTTRARRRSRAEPVPAQEPRTNGAPPHLEQSRRA